ncbi:hypothetical protein Pyn_20084 [Prunus yedoensis var. nudiflora]|uniref:Uncharacterized protein n=1 Tax=Prunus yedoensis var. nudiflora TaxID=2094558 RepID=A0A314Z2G1_PRUYE|nr:hypothetical protein Pyn_20084 [Prunus yedoensis var. nudiflora]
MSNILSSITPGANDIASSVRATTRSQSNKSSHGNGTSVDTGNSGSTGDTSAESTADTHHAVNGSHKIEENRNGFCLDSKLNGLCWSFFARSILLCESIAKRLSHRIRTIDGAWCLRSRSCGIVKPQLTLTGRGAMRLRSIWRR